MLNNCDFLPISHSFEGLICNELSSLSYRAFTKIESAALTIDESDSGGQITTLCVLVIFTNYDLPL